MAIEVSLWGPGSLLTSTLGPTETLCVAPGPGSGVNPGAETVSNFATKSVGGTSRNRNWWPPRRGEPGRAQAPGRKPRLPRRYAVRANTSCPLPQNRIPAQSHPASKGMLAPAGNDGERCTQPDSPWQTQERDTPALGKGITSRARRSRGSRRVAQGENHGPVRPHENLLAGLCLAPFPRHGRGPVPASGVLSLVVDADVVTEARFSVDKPFACTACAARVLVQRACSSCSRSVGSNRTHRDHAL